MPSNYAPFNVQNVNGRLIVTFAQQDTAKHDDVAGAGHGLVAVLDPATGTFTPLVPFGAAQLNSPWGLEIAPAHFGAFSNDLLVGNFGDGTINVFDPITGAFLGTLDGLDGQPLVIGDLWGLIAGDSARNANPDAIYFHGRRHG